MGIVTCVRAQVALICKAQCGGPFCLFLLFLQMKPNNKPSGDLKAAPSRASEKLPAVFLFRVEAFSRLDSGVH
jgi:hypothetical protein